MPNLYLSCDCVQFFGRNYGGTESIHEFITANLEQWVAKLKEKAYLASESEAGIVEKINYHSHSQPSMIIAIEVNAADFQKIDDNYIELNESFNASKIQFIRSLLSEEYRNTIRFAWHRVNFYLPPDQTYTHQGMILSPKGASLQAAQAVVDKLKNKTSTRLFSLNTPMITALENAIRERDDQAIETLVNEPRHILSKENIGAFYEETKTSLLEGNPGLISPVKGARSSASS